MSHPSPHRGLPVEQRKATNDTRGYVSELLDKCLAQGALDAELSSDDRERMKALLNIFGPLDSSGKLDGNPGIAAVGTH